MFTRHFICRVFCVLPHVGTVVGHSPNAVNKRGRPRLLITMYCSCIAKFLEMCGRPRFECVLPQWAQFFASDTSHLCCFKKLVLIEAFPNGDSYYEFC